MFIMYCLVILSKFFQSNIFYHILISCDGPKPRYRHVNKMRATKCVYQLVKSAASFEMIVLTFAAL